MVVKFRIPVLFGPLRRSSPFIGELLCQAIQMEHGPYIAERTQNAVYIVNEDPDPGLLLAKFSQSKNVLLYLNQIAFKLFILMS
jgi:hypothetical protein